MNARQRRKAKRAVQWAEAAYAPYALDFTNVPEDALRKALAGEDHTFDRMFIGVDHGVASGSYEVVSRVDRHGVQWVTPAPRYDEVFFEGVAWLNTL